MGQANDRGTFEERRDKAILRRETERKAANAAHLAQHEAREAKRWAAGMKKRSPLGGIMLAPRHSAADTKGGEV